MKASLSVDLHKLAKFVNLSLPVLSVLFFFAGLHLSFYFHFATVTFLLLTVINLFYLRVQRSHALLGNFGIIGQARYMMESIGPELRQYFFANDTEERPFNRNERAEVYRKAKNVDSAASFGSQQNFDEFELKLRHTMFPVAKSELQPFSLTLGEERGIANAYTLSSPFMISAMSYGALGEKAVRSLSRGAKKTGILMNTGEGGYPKYHLEEGGNLIFQIGTAKFGVRTPEGHLDEAKLKEVCAKDQIKMIEIKLSQGAKPGKGGMLPKEKITQEISELRGVPLGKDVISPPSHVECTSPEATVEFIKRIQEISQLPVGIKLCLGRPEEFEELVEAMIRRQSFPDWITVDGSEGGTGAAPKAFLDSVGIPIYPALKIVGDILKKHNVRDRLKVFAGGKLISPARQIMAFCLGADAIYTARDFMLALGCIQALECGNNTCPVGITTHDPSLQRGLDIEQKANRVCNYVHALEHDLRELLSATGCRSVREFNEEHLFIPKGTILSSLYTKNTLAPVSS